jgi:60 kDa SS-A/Ro ribonucleoprotein
MRTNPKAVGIDIRTHGGASAHLGSLKPFNQLRRSVLACLLFEDTFYEDGESVADRIARAAADPAISPFELAELAVEARVSTTCGTCPCCCARSWRIAPRAPRSSPTRSRA